MQASGKQIRLGVEILTRMVTSADAGSGLAARMPTTDETLTALASAGIMLAFLAGTEHGERDHHEAMRWALSKLGSLYPDDEDAGDGDSGPGRATVALGKQRMMTVKELIEHLTVAAARLPMGLDSAAEVAICHKGTTDQSPVMDVHVWSEVDKEKGSSRPFVLVRGHPHVQGCTNMPGSPEDPSEYDEYRW
ncbi:MAG: hypothetical protein ACRDYX_07055 [Egibacteraceae bacterium]